MGQILAGGWLVTQRLPRSGEPGAEHQTGGCFSVGYIATKGARKAFVKALDVQGVIENKASNRTLMERLKEMTDGHAFESAILDVCRKAKLDRVVEVIASDQLELPGSLYGLEVPYIMFEMADGDIRKAISASEKIDAAWKFRVLHDVAVGIQQLHRNDISHQDLKPSNVLVFDQGSALAKIGDLGRSSRRGLNASHDGNAVPGAVAYAPPEQIFGIRPERWEDRREGCDIYHIGALAAFLFTGVVLSASLAQALPSGMRPFLWGGQSGCDYETALPILKKALTEFVADAQPAFPVWAAEELSQIIMTACDPDYRVRGDATARQRIGNTVGIDAFVSRFDRLAKNAAVKTRR
ncbi:protein kinase domain-containing protein [Variovorax guangxiensis]|uniref:protein kinase domain-containing protein n=1 Tax=Variovorax guangxiensis TaxID=1775474 RepID=UPI00285B01DB|nr:protein kinase [Variovorax guangxiensis]MDR6860531.1 serine/threonine protein kinase [Variovorax guangxiensis]